MIRDADRFNSGRSSLLHEVARSSGSVRTVRVSVTIDQSSTCLRSVKIYFIGAEYTSGTRKLRYTIKPSTCCA